MDTVAEGLRIAITPQNPGIETQICLPDKSSTTHIEDELMLDDDTRDAIAREVRYAFRENTNGQSGAGRSVDTLRRDIGIFAILLGMMVQTGAAFYWAGGVSRTQESNKETMTQMQQEQSYTRAQLQLIDGQLKMIQGKQDAQNTDKRK